MALPPAVRRPQSHTICLQATCNMIAVLGEVHMVMQEKCRNRHPPDARKGSETIAAQQSSTKQDRAAAWRAHNAAMEQGQRKAPSSKEQPLWQTCDGQQNFQSGKPHDAQSATTVQHKFSDSTGSPLAQGFLRGASQLPSASLSCEATDVGVNEDPSYCVGGPAGQGNATARKKLSYARLGPAGQCFPSDAPILYTRVLSCQCMSALGVCSLLFLERQ